MDFRDYKVVRVIQKKLIDLNKPVTRLKETLSGSITLSKSSERKEPLYIPITGSGTIKMKKSPETSQYQVA